MGYTVTIKPDKSKADLVEKMLNFMEKVADSSTYGDFPYLEESKNLSYCNKRGHIGFDYGPNMIRREYCYVLIHWLAYKIGDGQYYYYDGTREKLSENRNKLGIRPFDEIEIEYKFYDGVNFQADIEKIDAAWEALDK